MSNTKSTPPPRMAAHLYSACQGASTAMLFCFIDQKVDADSSTHTEIKFPVVSDFHLLMLGRRLPAGLPKSLSLSVYGSQRQHLILKHIYRHQTVIAHAASSDWLARCSGDIGAFGVLLRYTRETHRFQIVHHNGCLSLPLRLCFGRFLRHT